MKKLGLVLLLPACLQQGLVADPNAVINATTTTTTGETGDPVPTISLTKKSSQYLKTNFGEMDYENQNKPIEGFGGGALGETFCFNNESSGGDAYDSQVTCRKPFSSANSLSDEEDTLLNLLTQETGRQSASGLGMLIQ